MPTLKIFSQWASPTKAMEHYNFTEFTNITLVDSLTADFYLIINYPSFTTEKEIQIAFSDKSKLIYCRMEPTYFFDNPALGIFSNFPKELAGHCFPETNMHLTLDWKSKKSCSEILNTDFSKNKRYDKMIAIVSSLYSWPGHRKRIDFLKYIEKNHPDFDYDLYGRTNDHSFLNHKGPIPENMNDCYIEKYKYSFNCENSAEPYYFTEKIMDSILAETLCFYWGCPNLEEFLDPRSYILLDLDDFEKSYNTIIESIKNNEWEKRLPYIKLMKQKIILELNPMAKIQSYIDRIRK
jgi:hypothetical protein